MSGRGALLLQALRRKKEQAERAAAAEREQQQQQVEGATAAVAELAVSEGAVAAPASAPEQVPTEALPSEATETGSDVTTLVPLPTEPSPSANVEAEKEKEKAKLESTPAVFQERDAVTYRGTAGKPIPIAANMLSLNFIPGGGVFEHRVAFNPPIDSKRERFRLLWAHQDKIPRNKIFDGFKLLLPTALGSEEEPITELKSKSEESGIEHDIVVRFVGKKSLQDPELIQVANCLFGRVFRQLNMAMLRTMGSNRSFFNPALKDSLPRHKLEIWPGYNLIVDYFEGGLHVQCDLASKVMRTQTVLDIITECFKTNKANVGDAARKALLGFTVITRYNNKSYKIDELDFEASPEDTFPNKRTGEDISFLDYYSNAYCVEIKDKKQPMIISHLKPPNAKPDDTPIKIYLIPELCFLIGMTDAQRSDFKVMKDVATFTRHTPTARQESMLKFFRSIKDNPEVIETFKSWGLQIADANVRLEGRLVAPPTLHFGKGQKEAVGPKADWGRATTSKPGLKMVDLTKWTLVVSSKDKASAKTFFDVLAQVSPKMGMKVARPTMVELPNDRLEGYLKAIREVPKESQIVLTIFPGGVQKADRYAAVKKLCYIDKALPSQVLMQKTIANEKRQQAVVQKVALQMNCKLGGELWGLAIPIKHLCVVGIDVYRDKSASGRNIAAIVTSINGAFSRYFSQLVFEKTNTPLHHEMAMAVANAMGKYKANNGGVFPDRVIVYRDGVPGGHFTSLVAEADAIREAMAALDTPNPPSVTYMIVQKRINTRLFDVSKGKADNPPAGTVVDHTITLHACKDFFLVPMNVMQGTVTPTHYIILSEPEDERKLKPDVVQKVTFALTHMYFNWPGNVKVPAPCQYAHKLVEMVGEHLHKQAHPDLSETLFYL